MLQNIHDIEIPADLLALHGHTQSGRVAAANRKVHDARLAREAATTARIHGWFGAGITIHGRLELERAEAAAWRAVYDAERVYDAVVGGRL